ncbi:MAG: carbon-nitrogen hydrolase [bacterium]|nr:carbon-nitrogen hydrolase [bacterium]
MQLTAGEDPAENLERTVAEIRAAAKNGAQIVCTQELFCSRYFCQTEDANKFDLAEPIPGPTTERLQILARELDIVILASLFERRMPGLYHNTAAVIDAGGELLGIYRKMHIPDDPEYYEKYYFTPGDLGFRVWDTRYGRIAVLICWDQWFPEGARAAALQGAEVLFYPTAIGWHDHESADHAAQHEAWQTMQRSHAIANGVYVVAVNRVGREDQLTFFGQSFAADPFGRIVHRSPADAEETIVLDLDPALIESTRRDWPFLRDRRIEYYGDLNRRGR